VPAVLKEPFRNNREFAGGIGICGSTESAGLKCTLSCEWHRICTFLIPHTRTHPLTKMAQINRPANLFNLFYMKAHLNFE